MSRSPLTLGRMEPVPNLANELSVRERGAYFTPRAIADFLAEWAMAERSDATVLDPTCGDGSFLEAAGRRFLALGATPSADQLIGVDIDRPSLRATRQRLAGIGLRTRLRAQDFLTVSSPDGLFGEEVEVDAVVGNPPYVRYQRFTGSSRTAGRSAALSHGVRLSGLASSWAPILVHAASFLKDDGRLAMVLPAELLTVGYAEPIRRWLLQRFAAVKLVLFERLQFADAQEDVVLLLAHGSGGCDAFSLYYVEGAVDLSKIRRFDEWAVGIASNGKWTDLLLPLSQRRLFRDVAAAHYQRLDELGTVELGSVTGNNSYFALTEAQRVAFELTAFDDVKKIAPPGTRYLRGLAFTPQDWIRARDQGLPVWLLSPEAGAPSPGLERYIELGESLDVHLAYKCRAREVWWRPTVVSPPDLLFTYMSHRFPRMFTNKARVSILNSMHGVRLRAGIPAWVREIMPLASLNSVTILGAELGGRSYGGGILKMEPREAAGLPVPSTALLADLRDRLAPVRRSLREQLRQGLWTNVVAAVDRALLIDVIGLAASDARDLHEAARVLRSRRMSRSGESLD